MRGLAAAIRARFAELVAFKNTYFGRSRSTATSSRIAPPIEREEIGVLTLHSVGDLTFLSWEGPGLIEPPRAFSLRTPTFKPTTVYDAFEPGNFGKPLDDRELRARQNLFLTRIFALQNAPQTGSAVV